MLRLDKTISRKTTLHADHDAEDRARWQAISIAEKREVVEYLQHQTKCLEALCETGRKQELDRSATSSKDADSVN